MCGRSCFPYGLISAVPIALVSTGWSFILVATFSCTTFRVCKKDTDNCFFFGYTEEYSLNDEDFLGRGYDYYYRRSIDTSGDCASFLTSGLYILTDDAKHWLPAGYALGIMALVLGALTLLGALSGALFLRFPRRALFGFSCLCFFNAAVSISLGCFGFFTMYCEEMPSEFSCSPATGAILAYLAILVWILAGTSFLFLHKFERRNQDVREVEHATGVLQEGREDEKASGVRPVLDAMNVNSGQPDVESLVVAGEGGLKTDVWK